MDKNESREDYLEAVLQLISEGKRHRSIDVARKLGFSKPSVSVAVKKLRQEGFVYVLDDGTIELTNEGKTIAENTLNKHIFLTEFFVRIGVNPTNAEEQACKIEHDISEDTFQKLKKFLEK